MHSEFVNYLPELGWSDLLLMHVQWVLMPVSLCGFFCVCNFMGTDSGTNTQGRLGGHIALESTTKTSWSFISPHPVRYSFPDWLLKPQLALFPLACGLVLWHLLIYYAVLALWALAFWGMEMRGDTNTLPCWNLKTPGWLEDLTESFHRMSVESQSRKKMSWQK